MKEKSIVPRDYEREILNDIDEVRHLQDDFDYARDNIYAVIHKGQTALEHMLDIAEKSGHPAAFETLAKMVKVQGDLSKVLLSIHSQKKDVKERSDVKSANKMNTSGDTINNNLFVGSTADLMEAMKSIQKNTEEIESQIIDVEIDMDKEEEENGAE